MTLAAACAKIKLILSDVDGVLTDGGVWFTDDGRQLMEFHIRDGLGVRLWHEAGGLFGIVTGRDIEAVRRRAAQLKVDILRQGIDDKLPVVDAIAEELGLTREEICYVGDDLLDLRAVRAVGLGCGPWPTPPRRSARRRPTAPASAAGTRPCARWWS